ncbi:hypothetical protein [Pseudomonas koreensis]|uniref:hypothetical protein n=1 Tax=Pseudomonas koreensis TaxID=198620 RepID=UPI0021CD04C3|nr:hypothetical protein [Pseudomonas koreensis]
MPFGIRRYRKGLSILRKARQCINGMSDIAFSGVWTFLDDVRQFVSHNCNIPNGREDGNRQYGVVEKPEVIQEDFEGAFCVVSPFYFFYCG